MLFPSILILSSGDIICGDVKRRVFKPQFLNIDSQTVDVDPFPFVPATTIDGNEIRPPKIFRVINFNSRFTSSSVRETLKFGLIENIELHTSENEEFEYDVSIDKNLRTFLFER